MPQHKDIQDYKRCLRSLLLLFGFLLFFNPGNAQVKANKDSLAGIQLQKASNHYYLGTGLMLAGTVGYLVSSQLMPIAQAPLLVISAIAGVIGTILALESYSHIHKAGKILLGHKYKPKDSDGLILKHYEFSF